MLKLYCTKCSYSFEKDRVPSRCPYCAEDGSIREEKSAQEVLDEVEMLRKA